MIKGLILISIAFLTINTSASELTIFLTKTVSPLLLIGETHNLDYERDELTAKLKHFRVNGGEVLALEMVESIYQDYLNSYINNETGSKRKLYLYLKVRWGYNTDNYMKLIKEARAQGLDLLAVDLDRRIWPKETRLYPVPPDVSKVRAAREAHMAKILCQETRKTILLIGSFHIKDKFLPTALKNECYKDFNSIKL